MALTQVKAAGLEADAIDETKLADNSIDSEHYNDGSIDNAHLANNAVDTDEIADDAVTADKLANSINTEIAANTAKVTNATHTGEVTGATALTIADNAVTLAKMAGGTDGQIITYDASGDPVAVGPGTDGQVLTSTGAGSPPAFETLTTSGEAFQARMTTSGSYSANDIIIYNSDADSWNTYDVGNNYDSSTGKYTAPVDGVYYFEAQAMTTGWSNNDSTQDGLQLKSNHGMISYPRQRRSTFRSEDDAHGYYTNSIAGTAKLSAGDTVWIVTSHACGVSNTQYSYFTGWLIA